MYYIGVDVGGTNIATGLVSEEGGLLFKTSVKTLGQRAPEEIVKDIYHTIETVLKETDTPLSEIGGIGLGIPGCFDSETGAVICTNNMNLSGFNLFSELRKYIDKPMKMANDANCAALGEAAYGAAKGYRYAVMVTLGTGIGGGFVMDEKVYNGFNGAAMEVGHMTIDLGGKLCNCGRSGCWECYASATALVEQTKEMMEKYPDSAMHQWVKENGSVSGRTAFDCARQGDEAANLVVDTFASYLAIGLTDLINLFQPDVIVIGGGISHEGDFLLDKVSRQTKESSYAGRDLPNAIYKTAQLGNDAGIIGAGMLLRPIIPYSAQ